MSDLAVTITGYVAGDTLEIRRTVSALESPVAVAWLTLKLYRAQPDAEAPLQKRVTPVDAPGTGQVETAGDKDTPAVIRFDLTAAETLALGTQLWTHDVQVKLANGAIYTVEIGTIQLSRGVTEATT